MSGQTVVGTLVVNLKANTASFQLDMAKMPVTARTAANGVKNEFDKVDFRESNEGARLLNEMLGTHLPRGLTRIISQLPALGTAFAVALPVIAVAVFVEKIVELIDHVEKAAEAAKKAANEYEAFALASGRHAQAIEVENLKLGDQLRVLQGAPTRNGPAIAMEERDQLENARLYLAIDQERDKLRNVVSIGTGKSKLSTGSSHDANGKFLDAEETKRRADEKASIEAATALGYAYLYDAGVQAQINAELQKQKDKWDEIAALNTKDALTAQEHIYKMQEASGLITKRQADAQIAALYAQAELKDAEERNKKIKEQLALVAQLDALTKGGTVGSEYDRKAYAKALEEYQKFLLEKERAKAASEARIYKAEEDAAARTFAIQKRAIDGVTNLINSGVQGWISGQESFAQAAQKSFASFAESATMGFIKAMEQQIIFHTIGNELNEEDKLKDAGASARKVFKSVMDSGIPFPLNVAIAPVAAAGAFAASMAFERGGEVPDGVGGVPALLHPREMVLSASLADVVRGAAANHSGGNTNGNARHATYAPTINAGFASAEEIDAKLKGHFDRWVRSEARKRYMGT